MRRGSRPFPYRIDNNAVVETPGGRLGVRTRRGPSQIPTHAKRTAAEPPARALNRDLLQLRRRAGGEGSNATRRDRPAPPIRETVFGREVGHERSDDQRDTRLSRDGSRRRTP